MCFPLIIVEEIWFISNGILQLEVCYLNLMNKIFKSYCHLGSEGKQLLISPKCRVVIIRILFNWLCLLKFITRDIHGQGSSAWTIGMVHQLLLCWEGMSSDLQCNPQYPQLLLHIICCEQAKHLPFTPCHCLIISYYF